MDSAPGIVASTTSLQGCSKEPTNFTTKVKRFASAEIVSRFLHARPDYPRDDTVKLRMLLEVASQGLERALPSLAHVTDVCVLYDVVDSVADEMVVTYFPDCPLSPNDSNTSELLGPVQMFGIQYSSLPNEGVTMYGLMKPGQQRFNEAKSQMMNNSYTGPDGE